MIYKCYENIGSRKASPGLHESIVGSFHGQQAWLLDETWERFSPELSQSKSFSYSACNPAALPSSTKTCQKCDKRVKMTVMDATS